MFTVITLQFIYRYHTGSLAFGALILSIVQFIRIFLEYLDHKLKGMNHIFMFSSSVMVSDVSICYSFQQTYKEDCFNNDNNKKWFLSTKSAC